ncbi:CBS domain-containing protein [Flexithrix dorotheae]|uniref:CBS domain-containing protein n=1 Tax=Flexithrix dorotheae TaxID=70993 RepID=UPI0003AAD9F9|nr:CBS domain-containing protein [Flexithrix dorotheae]
MVAKKYIDKGIPSLKPSDTVGFAKDLLEEYSFNWLPVVENQQYLGLFSDSFLSDFTKEDEKIELFELKNKDLKVHDNYHFFELARISKENQLDLIPVLNEENKYKGAINVKDAALDFAEKLGGQSIGGIIVISIATIDYTLAEISRLIESNEAKVLSSFVEINSLNNAELLVTIKVNTVDLTRIIATFERFGYSIVAKFHDYETQNFESDHLDSLLKYLEL